ncbi:LOW QUALITY PROTEIN: hypothetical protein PHMEG_00023045 [Phytophthora megakarya]|uniref:Uncharacterized protein n=1 Tax=Phytophthora megakarya TaxID=4795 RepID=A0A225VJ14_9STRA|nr:LOW QUALITY PROTEIN: hypothetical protein PHMEG_00023045 [Phytophthora megakarya]
MISSECDTVTEESDGVILDAPIDDVTVVVSVVDLLLHQVEFERDEWGFEKLQRIQTKILDRILGKYVSPATRTIESIVQQLIDESSFPDFNLESRQRSRLTESSLDVDNDAYIVDRLKADPVLLIQEESSFHNATSTPSIEDKQPARASSASKTSDKETKYAFTPCVERQEVQEKLTAEPHTGKEPAVYVSTQICPGAVLLKYLPGMLSRACDGDFGVEGLSITHFQLMDRKRRIEWINCGGANFSKVSTTADYKPAPQVTSIRKVVDSAHLFATFAGEYCGHDAVTLIDVIIALTETKVIRMTWET